jgi:hypothetical protein
VNAAAVNLEVQRTVPYTDFTSLNAYPEEGLLGYIAVLFYFFKELL